MLLAPRPIRGPLGKTFSLLAASTDQVQIVSVKKAEDSDEIVVRFRELSGHPAPGVRLTSGLSITGAREINGQEQPLGRAHAESGGLSFDLAPYQLRAFALKTGTASRAAMATISSQPLALPYDLDVVSSVQNPADGGFDAAGHTYPAEQFPTSLVSRGISFQLGPVADGRKKRGRLSWASRWNCRPDGSTASPCSPPRKATSATR